MTVELPPTSSETRVITEKESRVKDLQERVGRLHRDLTDGAEPQKEDTQRTIDRFTGDLRKLRLEIELLQSNLRELAKSNEPAANSGVANP